MESFDSFQRNLTADLQKVKPEDKLQYLKDRISRLEPEYRVVAETWALWAIELNIPPVKGLLIAVAHGIRTDAVWQSQLKASVASKVERENVYVEPIRLGFVDVFRFAAWFPYFRRLAIKSATTQLRFLARDYRNSDIVIVAHSFGTYVISHFLKENLDFEVKRILFCGSIVPETYQWEALPNLPKGKVVINEIGTSDFWPVFAKSFTWGYGTAGVNGFRSTLVKNRYHDVDHSGFFTEEMYEKFWLPFLIEGDVVESPHDAKRAGVPWCWSAISLFSCQGLILLILLVAILSYILVN